MQRICVITSYRNHGEYGQLKPKMAWFYSDSCCNAARYMKISQKCGTLNSSNIGWCFFSGSTNSYPIDPHTSSLNTIEIGSSIKNITISKNICDSLKQFRIQFWIIFIGIIPWISPGNDQGLRCRQPMAAPAERPPPKVRRVRTRTGRRKGAARRRAWWGGPSGTEDEKLRWVMIMASFHRSLTF